jgi:hypothetical protein
MILGKLSISRQQPTPGLNPALQNHPNNYSRDESINCRRLFLHDQCLHLEFSAICSIFQSLYCPQHMTHRNHNSLIFPLGNHPCMTLSGSSLNPLSYVTNAQRRGELSGDDYKWV